MTFNMSAEAQTIKVYNLRADTNEFIGTGDAWIPPFTGLPAHCTEIAPPDGIPDNAIAIFDADSQEWFITEDHRGQTVYDISNGQPVFITDPGPLPDNTTTIVPEGDYLKWDGEQWVQDPEALKQAMTEKAEAQRQTLLNEANTIAADWRTELMLGVITDEDKASLTEWMVYIKALRALDFSGVTDEATYEAISWPAHP